MILFADNDILMKLAGCDLLIPFCDAIKLENQDCYVTSTAHRAIPSQAKKGKNKLTNPDLYQKLVEFVNRTKVITDAAPQHEILDELSIASNIDPGEAQLILSAYNNPSSKMATGDRRCLVSLLNAQSLQDITHSLSQRVYTLEIAMLILIEKLGYEFVNQKVIQRCVDDTVLRMAFGESRSVDNAIACLSSYSSEVIPLLSDSHLIKKID